jgi:predicted 3-demethylubiquinone-9 3-methyltransferase (glyoxalase superfamily)
VQDKFGICWQIIPSILPKLLTDKNPKKAQAAMQAMLQMKKIDGKALQDAYDRA